MSNVNHPSSRSGGGAFLSRLVDSWRRRRALREIEALSFEIRKDIGWRG
jgi:hypothetical protein